MLRMAADSLYAVEAVAAEETAAEIQPYQPARLYEQAYLLVGKAAVESDLVVARFTQHLQAV